MNIPPCLLAVIIWTNTMVHTQDVREPGDTSCRNCQHQYTFRGAARGIFTSPGFPDNYPDKTTCCYFFNARDDGRVRIEFDYFDLEKSENAAVPDTCTLNNITSCLIVGYPSIL